MNYPRLMWRRSVVISAMLERSKSDALLVAEINDTGKEGSDTRYQARWLAGGTQDTAGRSTLDAAKVWVRELVAMRMGVVL